MKPFDSDLRNNDDNDVFGGMLDDPITINDNDNDIDEIGKDDTGVCDEKVNTLDKVTIKDIPTTSCNNVQCNNISCNEISKETKSDSVFGVFRNESFPNANLISNENMEPLTEDEVNSLLNKNNNSDFHFNDSISEDVNTDPSHDVNVNENENPYTKKDEDIYISLIKEYIINNDENDTKNYNYNEFQTKSLFIRININTLSNFVKRIKVDKSNESLFETKGKILNAIPFLQQYLCRIVYNTVFGNKSLALRYILYAGKKLSLIVEGLAKFDMNYTLKRPVKRMINLYNTIIKIFDEKYNKNN